MIQDELLDTAASLHDLLFVHGDYDSNVIWAFKHLKTTKIRKIRI